MEVVADELRLFIHKVMILTTKMQFIHNNCLSVQGCEKCFARGYCSNGK